MLALALWLAAGGTAPTLPPADEAAIMEVLCDADLTRDKQGWVCTDPNIDDFGIPFQQRMRSAWRGRFVDHPGEWIVTLTRPCMGPYCPSESHVLRKVGRNWRVTHALELDRDIGDPCLVLAGTGGARDRLVCLAAVGPHQGFMSEYLNVLSFAGGEATTQTLMAKEQGGECFLDPPLPEHQEDELTLLSADGAGFTARLRVRRAPCDAKTDDRHGPVITKGEHILRFVRRHSAIAPDAATAEIIRRHDWEAGPVR